MDKVFHSGQSTFYGEEKLKAGDERPLRTLLCNYTIDGLDQADSYSHVAKYNLIKPLLTSHLEID